MTDSKKYLLKMKWERLKEKLLNTPEGREQDKLLDSWIMNILQEFDLTARELDALTASFEEEEFPDFGLADKSRKQTGKSKQNSLSGMHVSTFFQVQEFETRIGKTYLNLN